MDSEKKVELSRLEDVSQLVLNIDDLFEVLTKNVKKINKIQYACHDDLKCSWKGKVEKFSTHLNSWHVQTGKQEKIILTLIQYSRK